MSDQRLADPSDVTSTQPEAESDDYAPEAEQTTASEPSQSDRSSEPERVRGLQAVVGRKEHERQQALAERDAAIAERDEAASALAEMQAEYDAHMEGYTEDEAPAAAQRPVADPDDEPANQRRYDAPVLQQNNGMVPANPLSQPRPRMSDQEAALRGMEQVFAEHLRGIN